METATCCHAKQLQHLAVFPKFPYFCAAKDTGKVKCKASIAVSSLPTHFNSERAWGKPLSSEDWRGGRRLTPSGDGDGTAGLGGSTPTGATTDTRTDHPDYRTDHNRHQDRPPPTRGQTTPTPGQTTTDTRTERHRLQDRPPPTTGQIIPTPGQTTTDTRTDHHRQQDGPPRHQDRTPPTPGQTAADSRTGHHQP